VHRDLEQSSGSLIGREVAHELAFSVAGTEPGLVSYWRLDEGAGINVEDLSGHDNGGTLMNGPTWVPSTAPVLKLNPIARLTNGHVQLQFFGAPLQSYRLQASTDLSNWAAIQTNNATARGVLQFQDAEAAIIPKRFYRTVTP